MKTISHSRKEIINLFNKKGKDRKIQTLFKALDVSLKHKGFTEVECIALAMGCERDFTKDTEIYTKTV